MKRYCVRLVVACFAIFASSVRADLNNGDFSAGQTDWFFDGDAAIGGPISSAILGEGSPFPGPAPGLVEQTFTLSAAPLSLSFEFDFGATADGTSGSFFDDLFEVDLFSAALPEFFTDSFGFASDAVLTVDRFGVFENQGTVGGGAGLPNLFTMDLSGLGLGAGDELTFTALLFGGSDGFNSLGSVDNVSVAVVPAPGAALLALIGLLPMGAWRIRRRTVV